MPPFRFIAIIAGFAGLLCTAPATAQDVPEYLLVRRNLEVESVRLGEMTRDSLRHLHPERGWVTEDLSRCVALFNEHATRRLSKRGIVHLVDGQQLPGEPAPKSDDADALHWNHETFGRLSIPIDDLSLIFFDRQAPTPEPGTSDVVQLRNGDRVEGFIIALNDPVVVERSIDGELVEYEIPQNSIAAIRFVSPPRPAKGQRIWLDDLTVIDVESIMIGADSFLRLRAPRWVDPDQDLNLQTDNLVAVLLEPGAIAPLASLRQTYVEGPETRYVTPPPHVRGEDVPLGLAAIEYRGPLTAHYELPAGATRFSAQAELPPESRAWGDYELVVRCDGRPLTRLRLNRESPAADLNLPLDGAELTIELNEGASGSIQDHLILRHAMVRVE